MTQFGRARKLVRPEFVPIAVGALIGGGMGVVIRGSGQFYTNIFLALCLLAFVVVVALVAVWASLTGRSDDARGLSLFVAGIVVAAAIAYTVAPHYRSPGAGDEYRATLSVHLTEPAATDWVFEGRCSTAPDRALMVISSTGQKGAGGVDKTLVLHLDMNAAAAPVLFGLSLTSAKSGSAAYSTSGGAGLEATGITPDGRRGSVRFVAAATRAASRGERPERLAGTIAWECS